MPDKRKFEEKYRRFEDADRSFDIRFWQEKGDISIFKAMEDMVKAYIMIRGGSENDLRLRRNIETYGKLEEKRSWNKNSPNT